MNRYGRMAQEYTREHLPRAFAGIADPERFFAEAGQEIAAAIAEVRDQILGERRPGETADDYRLRSSSSATVAEELVLTDHYLLAAEPETEDRDEPPDDPAYDEAKADYQEAMEAILRLSG